MKLFTALAMSAALLSNAAFALDAQLEKVVLYEGDGGKSNACGVGSILVRELYRVSNVPLDTLILLHANPKYGVTAKFVDSIIDDSLIDNNYCISKSDLSNFTVKARFMDSSGQKSAVIPFNIDMPADGLTKPEEWGLYKFKKLQNKMGKNDYSKPW